MMDPRISLGLIWLTGIGVCFLPTNAASAEFFPIGIYGIEAGHTNDFPVLQAAGFNCVQSYQHDVQALKSLLRSCESRGLKAIVPAGIHSAESSQQQVLEKRVQELGQFKSLLAWYISDEPDYQKIPPAEIKRLRNMVAGTETRVRCALVIGNGKAAADYIVATDILMVDWYPIPHLPLASFGFAVRQSRFAAGSSKPVWGVIQAFDWAEIFPRSKKLGIGGFPSEAELRAMSLLGVIEGASGVFFFSYQTGNKVLTQRPEEWHRVQAAASELSRLSPILVSPTVWTPLDLGIEPDKPRWRNAMGDEALQVARKRLEKWDGNYKAGDYLLIVNTTNERRKSRIHVPGLCGSKVDLAGQKISASIDQGWIEDDFEPYATRVYGPLPLE